MSQAICPATVTDEKPVDENSLEYFLNEVRKGAEELPQVCGNPPYEKPLDALTSIISEAVKITQLAKEDARQRADIGPTCISIAMSAYFVYLDRDRL